MAEPKLWQRAQTGSWYVTINGKQKSLGRDEEKARRKYHAILADTQPAPDESVYKLLNRHLAWCKKNRKPETFKARRIHLRRFAKFIGKIRKASDLKPFHVQRCLDRYYAGRSTTYQNDAITSIKGALNWAVEQGYIDRNPIDKMKKPRRTVRQEFVKSLDWQRVLDAATDQQFRDYLTVAFSSGARPQETRKIEARHFDREGRRIVFSADESKGEKRARVIYS
jgi:integrase